MSSVLHFTPSDSFQKEVLSHPNPVIVDFFATWCGPCKSLSPYLDQAAGQGIKVVKVDVDQNGELSSNYSVSSIPHVILFHNGQKIDEFKGMDVSALQRMVDYAKKKTNKFQGSGVSVGGQGSVKAKAYQGGNNLGSEPPDDDKAYHLAFRYEGKTFQRRFRPTDTVGMVKNYIRQKINASNIVLFTPLPRQEYNDDELIISICFSKREMLSVALK